MIEIHPVLKYNLTKCPNCKGDLMPQQLHWQGVHTCTKSKCCVCKKVYLADLPINQSSVLYRILGIESGKIFDKDSKEVTKQSPWFNDKLTTILNPVIKDVVINIEVRNNFDKVIILNTVDFVYGHSLLLLMNLQRLINQLKDSDIGIIVIVQPMMKWLIPDENIAEIWTVNLKFDELSNYYPSVSEQINKELNRFKNCYISNGYVLPTNEKIEIESFTKVSPFSFVNKIEKTRITYIWREDPGRLWIRNIYLLKGMQRLGFTKILLPFHLVRIKLFLYLLHKKLKGNSYQLTLAGLGSYGKFDSYVEDKRIQGFSEKEERESCQVYAESELVIGVHGSSMLLPSGHAGMTVSMMPSKRWGNFAEDILSTCEDSRLASFQQRIIPLNISVFETIDICVDMIKGRDYFIKKFIHPEGL